MMHGPEKSDSPIVATKPTNKAARAAAEPVERRGEAKGNAERLRTRRTTQYERRLVLLPSLLSSAHWWRCRSYGFRPGRGQHGALHALGADRQNR